MLSEIKEMDFEPHTDGNYCWFCGGKILGTERMFRYYEETSHRRRDWDICLPCHTEYHERTKRV